VLVDEVSFLAANLAYGNCPDGHSPFVGLLVVLAKLFLDLRFCVAV
jgi:hypothetical protein